MTNLVKLLNNSEDDHWVPEFPEIDILSIDDFLKLDAVHCQREVMFRQRRIGNLLKDESKRNATQACVQLIEAACDILLPNGDIHKKGERRVADANTRKAVWAADRHRGDTANIPSVVLASIYKASTKEDIERLYYSFDSSQSVEKTTEKITGICGSIGLNLQTGFLKKGAFVTPLKYACHVLPGAGDSLSLEAKIIAFKDELAAFDSIHPSKRSGAFDTTAVCGALMALKAYGCNQQCLDGLRRISENVRGASSPGNGTDGVTAIIQEWHEYNIFKSRGSCGLTLPLQLDFWLYNFEKFMDNTPVKGYRSSSKIPGRGCRKSKYSSEWYV